MSGNRFIRRGVPTDIEPKLGRAFLISSGLHVLLFLLFSGLILPRFTSERKPVYYVDLVNLPVDKPQAGRPDAAPKKAVKKKAARKTTPQAKKSTPVIRQKAPVPAKVEDSGPSDADIAARISRMKKKKESREEIDALKQKLAALANQDARGEDAAPDTPIGMPDGTGDEVGASHLAWLQAYLKQQWSLSEYQVTRLDLEAEVRIVFDAAGRMTDFSFLKKSGDRFFDESVRSAILKSQQLPKPPPVSRWQVDVVFNLKDLLDK